jgi:hypothetical protein
VRDGSIDVKRAHRDFSSPPCKITRVWVGVEMKRLVHSLSLSRVVGKQAPMGTGLSSSTCKHIAAGAIAEPFSTESRVAATCWRPLSSVPSSCAYCWCFSNSGDFGPSVWTVCIKRPPQQISWCSGPDRSSVVSSNFSLGCCHRETGVMLACIS